MARPKKEKLDYYPKDSDQLSNRKIRRILNEYGANGYLVYEHLLQLIYGGKGYYIIVDNNLAFDISDFLPSGISESMVKSMIEDFVNYGLFDKKKYEILRILTNETIQENYYLAYRGSKKILQEIIINAAKTPVIATITPVNVTETPVNVTESARNGGKMPQKKRKENKREEIKRKGKEKNVKNSPQISVDENDVLENKKQNSTDETVNDSSNEKKEKSSAKKEKEIFAQSRKHFLKQNPSYIWESLDDSHLQELLKKIAITLSRGNVPISTEQAFEDFLHNLPVFWRNRRFSMQNLSKNYNEILNEIRQKPYEQSGEQKQGERKFGRHTTEELSDFAENFGK